MLFRAFRPLFEQIKWHKNLFSIIVTAIFYTIPFKIYVLISTEKM